MHEVSMTEMNSTLDKHIENYESRTLLIDAVTNDLSVIVIVYILMKTGSM